MFIVWRQRPVTSDRRAELFFQSEAGRGEAPDPPAWQPLACEHRGPGRVCWVPCLVQAVRGDGVTRQRLLRRLPAIRSCCLADHFVRAAWWYAVSAEIRCWERNPAGPEAQALRRDRRNLLAKLREVVPPPTRAGLAAFTKYRLEREAQRRRLQGESRGRARREGPGGAAPSGGRWWEVLGLPEGATAEQVKARYRELALRHHPDRGGDPEQFHCVRSAYEEARRAGRG
jgi:hypothetical protein